MWRKICSMACVIVLLGGTFGLIVGMPSVKADFVNNTQLSASGVDSWLPSIASWGDEVHVAWVDTTSTNVIKYRYSLDEGQTWSSIIQLPYPASQPSIAVDDLP